MGDVHGEAGKVRRLIRKLRSQAGMNEDDIFIQLGDIVDRGSDVKSCIERFLKLEQEMECHWIRGNHENLMLEAIQNPRNKQQLWDWNGGTATRRSYHQAPIIYNSIEQWILEVPMSHRDFIYRQEYSVQIDDYSFHHAPIPKKEFVQKDMPFSDEEYYRRVIESKDKEILTWSWHGHWGGLTEDEFALQIPDGKIQVVGHVHDLQSGCNEARVYPHIIYTDAGSGCANWGKLCVVELPENKLWYADEKG